MQVFLTSPQNNTIFAFGKQKFMELQVIQNKIYEIRGQRVMIDRDLAEKYGVETRALNQAVKRNSERFPSDFMFQLTDIEFQYWKSQIVMSNAVNMGLRKKPFVFTELGVAMLSSVLYRLEKCNSPIFAHSIGLTLISIGIIPDSTLDYFIIHFGIKFKNCNSNKYEYYACFCSSPQYAAN